MRDDQLVIHNGHRRAASRIITQVRPLIEKSGGRYTITVAGESGSGKSEIAACLSEELARHDLKAVILQQDDYLLFPPKTNAEMRRKDIDHVGVSEVRIDVLDQNLADFKDGKTTIKKPLVIFEENRITSETVALGDVQVVIAEGTYTTMLINVDRHIFIDRPYENTKEARTEQVSEMQDDFLERVLTAEHRIISGHKDHAHIIISKDYEVET